MTAQLSIYVVLRLMMIKLIEIEKAEGVTEVAVRNRHKDLKNKWEFLN